MSAGPLQPAQSLLAGLLALGRTRLELFGAELQEEIARQAAALLGVFVVLTLAALAAAFGAIALLLAVGEAYRLAVALAIAALFALLAGAAAWTVRGFARAKPRAFRASIAQLERDRVLLVERSDAQRAALAAAASPLACTVGRLVRLAGWAARAAAAYSLLRTVLRRI